MESKKDSLGKDPSKKSMNGNDLGTLIFNGSDQSLSSSKMSLALTLMEYVPFLSQVCDASQISPESYAVQATC